MTGARLRQALEYAARGWAVFPCHVGQKTPATSHGHLDATTDPEQITAWFTRNPRWNLAIATGAPGPDVLDVDQRGPGRNGFTALAVLHHAGMLEETSSWVRTPSGGVHAYFAGSDQRNGHLPGCYLDFRSAGGYVLAPPSTVGGRPYWLLGQSAGRGGLDWDTVTRLLQPQRQHQPPPRQPQASGSGHDLGYLVRWVAAQPEGNRNAGLFWAANRALDADPAADLSPLAAAARHAGLDNKEITRTLDSARKTGQPRLPAPGYQAEAGDPS